MTKAKHILDIVDIKNLDPEKRAKIDRLLNPRHAKLSLKFRNADIDDWRACANLQDVSLTEFIENTLNERSAQLQKRK